MRESWIIPANCNRCRARVSSRPIAGPTPGCLRRPLESQNGLMNQKIRFLCPARSRSLPVAVVASVSRSSASCRPGSHVIITGRDEAMVQTGRQPELPGTIAPRAFAAMSPTWPASSVRASTLQHLRTCGHSGEQCGDFRAVRRVARAAPETGTQFLTRTCAAFTT